MKVIAFLFLLSLSLSGCFSGGEIRVWTHPTQDVMSWNTDGPPLVITVENPSDHPITAEVACYNSGDAVYPTYESTWIVKVPAHSFKTGLGQVMNRDIHANPCWLKEVKVAKAE